MTEQKFGEQMMRLSDVFGPKYYTTQRLKIILQSIRHVDNGVFERAVTRLIATKRIAPLTPEIMEAVEAVWAEDKQRARESSGSADIYSQLQSASKRTTADPDFVKACLKLLRDRLDGKLNHKQFIEGCDLLDEAARSLR